VVDGVRFKLSVMSHALYMGARCCFALLCSKKM
jgi:hypothetical protein